MRATVRVRTATVVVWAGSVAPGGYRMTGCLSDFNGYRGGMLR